MGGAACKLQPDVPLAKARSIQRKRLGSFAHEVPWIGRQGHPLHEPGDDGVKRGQQHRILVRIVMDNLACRGVRRPGNIDQAYGIKAARRDGFKGGICNLGAPGAMVNFYWHNGYYK